MQAPKSKPRTHRLSVLLLHPTRLTALALVVSMASLATMGVGAKASEKTEADRPSATSAETIEAEADAAKSAPAAPGDALGNYRLAPGDRISLVVFDEPQLSGEFFIDGGGDVLLPLAGSVRLTGLTLAEAQDLIRKQFANGVLVQPAVSVRIKEYRPIFVTGDVKRPGSYRFMFGVSVKAAIATAGGEGQSIEQPLSVAVSDFVTAEERVRQLEMDRVSLLVRKARLEAQRDERDDFVMPLLVGLNASNVNFQRAYSAESDVFHRLGETYRGQLATLKQQRPLIEAEIKAVSGQIANQNERLEIVNSRLADLEPLFRKGYLRKEVLTNQQIEKTLVQAQLSNLEAQVAHLRQTMGDLEVKLGEVKANQVRQVLSELQETTQRLRVNETIIGPARRVRDVKAEAASGVTGEADYAVSISRMEQGRMVSFNANEETMLLPGDVVEVKRKRPVSEIMGFAPTESAEDQSVSPTTYVAEQSASASR